MIAQVFDLIQFAPTTAPKKMTPKV